MSTEDVHMEGSTPAKTQRFVVRSDGTKVELDESAIHARVAALAEGLNSEFIDFKVVEGKVSAGLYDGVSTKQIDDLIAETCAYMTIVHPDYSILAARVSVTNLHKHTKEDFAECIADLRNYVDENGRKAPLVSEEVYEIV